MRSARRAQARHRGRTLATVIAGVAILSLAACGSDDDGGASATTTAPPSTAATTAAASTAPPASAAVDGSTQRFTDSLGRQVEIPARPQRIVALHDSSAGVALLSIGAPVVGVGVRDGEFAPYLRDFDLSNVAKLGNVFEYDIEAIAAAKPDLIVARGDEGEKDLGTMEAADELEAIAPTIYLTQKATPDEFMATMGTISGLSDEVARQKTEWETALAAAKGSLQPLTSSMSFSQPGDYEGQVYTSTAGDPTPRIQLALMLGMRMPPITAESDEIFMDVAAERLPELDADVIFISPDDTIVDNPLWGQLKGVQAGQVVELEPDTVQPGPVYRSYMRELAAYQQLLPTLRSDVVDESSWPG